MERGRAKAHRPLPREVRTGGRGRGLAAYGRGAWYLAHEELEPAWMGTDDPAERALLSGLIKLAAAYVHAARGNPLGVRTNLHGARERLATAAGARRPRTARRAARLAPPNGSTCRRSSSAWTTGSRASRRSARARCAGPDAAIGEPAALDAGGAVPSHDVAGPAGRFRGAPVAIPLLPLPRRPA